MTRLDYSFILGCTVVIVVTIAWYEGKQAGWKERATTCRPDAAIVIENANDTWCVYAPESNYGKALLKEKGKRACPIRGQSD